MTAEKVEPSGISVVEMAGELLGKLDSTLNSKLYLLL